MTAKSVRQQFADTMLELGKEDPKLVVVVGDISHGILQPFAKSFPDRYFNIGICEPGMMSVVAGIAKSGLRAVGHTIAPFIIDRSFEQLKLDFCYQKVPGNVVSVGSAFDYANLGCTHHCYSDFALIKALPFATMHAPGSAIEFDSLFRATYKDLALNVFRVPGFPHELDLDKRDIVPGKAILIAEGSDVTLVSTGVQLRSALGARELLMQRNISAEILHLPSVRPFDSDRVRSSVQKTKYVVAIEEHMRSGGLGEDVLRVAHEVGARFESASIPDTFVTWYGTYHEHCEKFGLSAEGVTGKVAEMLQR